MEIGDLVEVHDVSAKWQRLNGNVRLVQQQHQKDGHWTIEVAGKRFAIPEAKLRRVREDCIELKDVPGKGKGYCAKHEIASGDIILYEAPYCIGAHCESPISELATEFLQKLQKDTPETLAEIRSLSKGSDGFDGDGHPYDRMSQQIGDLAVVVNNSFQCVRDPEYDAFYVKASRFNHSCCPNAFADTSKERIVVRALRDIKPGEEACISYWAVREPLQVRQQRHSSKGFTCRCPRCMHEEANGDPMSLADSNLEQAQRLNHFLASPEAAMMNPLELVHMLEPAVKECLEHGTALNHPFVQQLVNNLANAHYFAATRVPGPHQTASLKAFLHFKRLGMDQQVLPFAVPGACVLQRDPDYFMSLHRILMVENAALDKSDCEYLRKCRREVRELCLTHFGQKQLPDFLASQVHVWV